MTISTTTLTDLPPRLVRLFAQAGIFSKDDVEKYYQKHDRQKSIVDILNQEVSLGSFADLFTYEIQIPFTSKKTKSQTLSSQLTAPTIIRLDELREMLMTHRPPLSDLIAFLESSKAVPAGALKAAFAKAEQLKEDPYDWIVREEILSPEVLETFLKSPDNPLVAPCALFLAFSVLENNRLVSAQDWEDLPSRIARSNGGLALKDLCRAIKLTPSELVERIESGLYLRDAKLSPAPTDPALLAMFPASLIRHQLFIPLFQDGDRIGLAISDPLNLELAVLIRLLLRKWMVPYFAPSGAVVDAINLALTGEHATSRSLVEKDGGHIPPVAVDGKAVAQTPPIAAAAAPVAPMPPAVELPPVGKGKESKKSAAEAKAAKSEKPAEQAKAMLLRPGEAPTDSLSAVQLVSSLIENAIELRATDIHLEPTRTQMVVRFRIDGQLTRILTLPANLISPLTSRIKVLANMDVTERRRPQDGHIMLNMDQRHFDFRIATMPTIFGEKVAVRILDSSRVMTGLKEIGLTPKQHEAAERMIRHTYGIIIVTGPTGSGKTSTLYAALNELNSEKRHLVTIEDPVEYQLDGISQVQVDPHVGLTFSDGLRATLRQDPDIIMVGEIRDPDTAKTAIRAALTGHLVFSTLHTNSALGAFQALAQLGASPFMIGSAITGVIAQRLVRKLCEKCKKSKPVPKALAEQLGLTYSTKLRLHRAVGCEECLGTGYSGRLGIFEVVEMTDRLRQGVLNDESPDRLEEIADKEGRISIREAGMEKLKAGLTSPEELVEKVILDS